MVELTIAKIIVTIFLIGITWFLTYLCMNINLKEEFKDFFKKESWYTWKEIKDNFKDIFKWHK